MTAEESLLELLTLSASLGVLKKAVFSKAHDASSVKTVVSPRTVGGTVGMQAETFRKDHKVFHSNLHADDLEKLQTMVSAHRQINLLTTVGECELRRAASGTSTLIGGDRLRRAMQKDVLPQADLLGNDRKKQYLLNGQEAFLKYLGVSDETGRVRDKKQSKFRQINRFLELTRDCVSHLPQEGTLVIRDLCCGKSYLSFAVYYYFSVLLGREVQMVGVDLKQDVIEYCNQVAQALDFHGLRFVCEDVARFQTETDVDLVVSLHACDTATDLVLAKAMEWNAKVILSTPCCHHELNHTIRCRELSFITEHSMLRQKFCDAATDALRLKLLQCNGYSVAALELIDPEETPKNILLRAVKKQHFDPSSPECERLRAEYQTAKTFLLGSEESV